MKSHKYLNKYMYVWVYIYTIYVVTPNIILQYMIPSCTRASISSSALDLNIRDVFSVGMHEQRRTLTKHRTFV
jgi:hypothetical protein